MEKNQMNEVIYTIGHKKLNGIMKLIANLFCSLVFLSLGITNATAQDDPSQPLVGDWTIYNADELPDAADPAWSASNGSGTVWSIEEDPVRLGNNILALDGADASGMFKTADFDPVPTAVTVVMRVKGKDLAADRLTDIDMHINGFRDQLNIRSNGQLTLQRSGASVDLSGLLNPAKWNIYRMTIDASSGTEGIVRVYLNENPFPVLTATTTTTTSSNYFRFGDGNGSPTYSAYVDYVSYDVTGAYSPAETRLPNELTKPPVGEWTIYHADELPDAADPAWSASNGSGTTWSIEADPTRVGNNVLVMDGSDASGMYKTSDFDPVPTAVTVVMRVKAKDLSADRLTDIDMHINGFRDQLNIRSNGELSLQRSGASVDLSETLNVAQWNVYRMTIDASSGTEGIVKIYLNESPYPVLTATTTTTTSSNYFRFGDGNGSPVYSSYVDYVSYDVTGAYSPEQTRLPNEVTKPPVGDWSIYAADELPDAADPAWSASNGSGTTWTIESDPLVVGNNILALDGSDASGMFKTSDFDPVPTAVTVAMRVKAKDLTADRLTDIDMHINGFRDQLNIRSNGQLSLQRSGASVDLSEVLNVADWNVFRMTIDASSGTEGIVKIYLNENASPVLTATTTTTTSSNYFRFGDGNGSPIYSAYIDYIVHDVTGAYSPAQTRLPASFTGDDEGPVPSLSSPSALSSFLQHLGTPTAGKSFTVSGMNLETDLTITPPTGYELSALEASGYSGETIALTPVDGVVSETTYYVRLNASEVGEYNGDVLLASGETTRAISLSGLTVVPEISVSGTLESFKESVSSSSDAQNYTVSAVYLVGDLQITAPTNFEVSLNGSDWTSSVSITPDDEGTVSSTAIYVRLNATETGSYSGDITHLSTDAVNINLAVSGETIPDPGINITGSLSAFSQIIGRPSDVQSYTVSGANLAGNLEISVPTHYQISFNGELWLSSLSLAPLDGNVAATTIYVRLNSQSGGNHSGTLTHTSVGVEGVSVSLSGNTDASIVLGEGSISDKQFKVWPNPTTRIIQVSAPSVIDSDHIHIYGLDGVRVIAQTRVLSKDKMEVDVSNLSKGVYLIELLVEGETITSRFIKE